MNIEHREAQRMRSAFNTYLFMCGKEEHKTALCFVISLPPHMSFYSVAYSIHKGMRELILDLLFVIKPKIHVRMRHSAAGHTVSGKQLWLYTHALCNPDLPIYCPSKRPNNLTPLVHSHYGVRK